VTFETEQSSCLTSRPFGSILALEGPFSNDGKKARHFGEKFWLYIVTDAGIGAPQLPGIQNPVASFRVGEGIFNGHDSGEAVGYAAAGAIDLQIIGS
jgi:hypothetical protein